ncbi:dihydrolipoyllysine-residue acetyltransferase [Allohahella sp. A8]|uniref:dihydrolipoyllysine-residue acetyltransferase n=1 Tax=Allohahella sp. A8 TaxID=3141461 RepID=UPI003A80B1CE
MSKEIRVPDLGGASDVEVIEIYVSEGDDIAAEDSILAMESDKASMDIPAPEGGRIKSIKVKVGDKLNEGDVIAELEEADAGDKADDEEDGTETDGDESRESADADESDRAEETPAPSPDSANRDPDGSEEQQTKESVERSADTGDEAGSTEVLTVPDLGDFGEVPVIEISVAIGDVIKPEDSLVVLESDKATMDVPASKGGKVVEILVAVNDKVKQGSPVVRIEVEGGGARSSDSEEKGKSGTGAAKDGGKSAERTSSAAAEKGESDEADSQRPEKAPKVRREATDGREPASSAVHAGPAVRKLARELGVKLESIEGSGPKQRILKEDLQDFVKSNMQAIGKAGSAGGGIRIASVPLPDFSQFGETSRQAMTKIQKLTAENMSRSWQTVPHVTQFDEADITELEDFRKAQKAAAERQNTKLTILPFLLKACAIALRRIPQFNVAQDFDRHELVHKDYVHIGMAVDTPSGLLVPVIRDVDQKSIWDIARECIELANKARDKKLKSSEMQGGCFTISSLGAIGGTAFTPIVNTPEVAILGVSRASIKPVYVEGSFQPRLMLPLSLSYDHRAVNGADAARFTSLLGELLGDIRHMLL